MYFLRGVKSEARTKWGFIEVELEIPVEDYWRLVKTLHGLIEVGDIKHFAFEVAPSRGKDVRVLGYIVTCNAPP